MPTSGDVVEVDLGFPTGREAGFRHPAVIVTARAVLEARPSVVQVVPLTSTIRGFGSEVAIEPDDHNGLTRRSAAQCHQIRAVATSRLGKIVGNVGPVALGEIRDTIGLILDIPG